MNVKERLKEAYANVSLNADSTWCPASDAYRKTNLELYSTEQHLLMRKLQGNRPRTVRECIPKSRLAQYSNYVYNESREMSYASSASSEGFVNVKAPSEPWEMPEVGELYRWFLKNQPEDHFSRRCRYESPLLSVSGFEDKILKIQITEDRVKNIWKREHETKPRTGQISVSMFQSPLKNTFMFQNSANQDWFKQISLSRDLEQIEDLSGKFSEETCSISDYLSNEPTEASTEILYSEVLQGVSPSRKLLTSKSEKPPVEDPDFTDYTVLQREEVKPEVCKFLPQKTFLQERKPQESTLRRSLHPTYFQQACFYNPGQRWVPTGFYPAQIVTSNWFAQSPREDKEEHPVSTSISEELEIQALEQYSNSNENFYQELERQAAEQYTSYPE